MSPIRVGPNLFVTEFDELKLGEIHPGVTGLVLAELGYERHVEKLKRLLAAFPALVRLGVSEASFDPDHLLFLMARLQYLRVESFVTRFRGFTRDFSAFIAIAPFTRCVFDFPTTPGLEGILPVFERKEEEGFTNFGLAVGGEPVYGVDDKCSICLDEETPCDFFTPCNHMFHRTCIMHMRDSRCPNCRDCILPPRRAHHLLPGLSVVWEGYEACAIGGLADSAIIVGGRHTDVPHLTIDKRAPRPTNLYLLVKHRNTANHYRSLPTHELHIFFQPKLDRRLTTELESEQGLKWRFSPFDGQRVFPHGVSQRALENSQLWNRLLDRGLDFETALEIFKSEEK